MKTNALIGTSGWNYDHWKKTFYPQYAPKKDWLEYYSSVFSTVEVNYSFYRWPNKKTLDKWHDHVPAAFRFSMKLPRIITHVKRLKDIKKHLKDFYKLTQAMKTKMGCYLAQLPPSFARNETNQQRLEEFVDILDGRKNHCIEFRHESWWTQEVFDLLSRNKVAFCTVSGLNMPKDIVLHGDIGYVRFHGNHYDKKYSKPELKSYMEKIRKSNCKRVYVYFNNDTHGYAPQNAKEMGEMNA